MNSKKMTLTNISCQNYRSRHMRGLRQLNSSPPTVLVILRNRETWRRKNQIKGKNHQNSLLAHKSTIEIINLSAISTKYCEEKCAQRDNFHRNSPSSHIWSAASRSPSTVAAEGSGRRVWGEASLAAPGQPAPSHNLQNRAGAKMAVCDCA